MSHLEKVPWGSVYFTNMGWAWIPSSEPSVKWTWTSPLDSWQKEKLRIRYTKVTRSKFTEKLTCKFLKK